MDESVQSNRKISEANSISIKRSVSIGISKTRQSRRLCIARSSVDYILVTCEGIALGKTWKCSVVVVYEEKRFHAFTVIYVEPLINVTLFYTR